MIDFFSVKRFSANQFNAKQEDIQTFQLIYVFPMLCGGLPEGKLPELAVCAHLPGKDKKNTVQ